MYALTELLERVPDTYVEALAESFRLLFGEPVAPVRALGTAQGLDTVIGDLDDRERMLLKILVFSGAENGIDSTQVWRSFDSGNPGGGVGRLLCERLRARGLIFEAIGGHGRTRYFMPLETHQHLSERFFTETSGQLPQVEPDAVQEKESYPLTMLCDVVRTLASLGTGGASLTHGGEIFKKDLTRIERGFLVRDWFRGGPPYRPEFPGRTAFITEFCLANGLLGYAGKTLVTREEVRKWIQRNPLDLMGDIYSFWLRWFLPRLGRVAPFIKVLACVPVGQWFGFDPLLAAIEPYMVAEWAENFRVQAGGLLRSGLHLGLLQAGVYQGRPAYCVSELGRHLLAQQTESAVLDLQPDDRLYIQPSFEVLAERELSPAVLWSLELVAELIRIDGLRTYRLTRDSLHQGLRWLSIDEVIAFLQEYGVDQPGNVLFTLRDWGSGFGRARFVPGLVLRCDDADLVEAIVHSPRLEEHHVERLNERDILIPLADKGKVLEILGGMGVTLWPAHDGDPTAPDPANTAPDPELPETEYRERRLTALRLNGFLPVSAPAGDQSRRNLLTQAIRAQKRLQILWAGPAGDRAGRVEPLGLIQGAKGWELLCVPQWSGRETRIALDEIRAVQVIED